MKDIKEPKLSTIFVAWGGWTALLMYLVSNIAYKRGKKEGKEEVADSIHDFMKENDADSKRKRKS